MSIVLFILISLFLLPSIHQESIAQVNQQDSLALVAIYNATEGEQWKRKAKWLSSNPVSDWFGITVTGNRVSGLSLSDNNLSGKLPDVLGNLTALTNLDLSINRLTGVIPATIGNLTALQSLSFAVNELEGGLPSSMVTCVALTQIALHRNNFSGEFPSVLTQMIWLESILLDQNDFEGRIPSEINNLKELHTLAIIENNFSGEFPSIASMQNLGALHIRGNDFTGDFETIFGTQPMPRLFYVTLDNNRLTGKLSANVFDPSKLRWFHARNNDFTSMGDFSQFSALQRLYCENNRLRFVDILPNIEITALFEYAPQDSLLSSEILRVKEGEQIAISSGLSDANVVYQWYRNGILLPAETDSLLVIENLSDATTGTYHCRMTHPELSDLTLYRSTLQLVLDQKSRVAEDVERDIDIEASGRHQLRIVYTGENRPLQYRIVSLQGRTIIHDAVYPGTTIEESLPNAGIYIVQIYQKNWVLSQKVILY